tara:strand:+ start:24 stop:695 length:672 start_codon:yes stop_codon:yes gene_type:complete
MPMMGTPDDNIFEFCIAKSDSPSKVAKDAMRALLFKNEQIEQQLRKIEMDKAIECGGLRLTKPVNGSVHILTIPNDEAGHRAHGTPVYDVEVFIVGQSGGGFKTKEEYEEERKQLRKSSLDKAMAQLEKGALEWQESQEAKLRGVAAMGDACTYGFDERECAFYLLRDPSKKIHITTQIQVPLVENKLKHVSVDGYVYLKALQAVREAEKKRQDDDTMEGRGE